jgi:hypothetical protein
MLKSGRSPVIATCTLAALLVPPLMTQATAWASAPPPGAEPVVRGIPRGKTYPLDKELQARRAAKSGQRSATGGKATASQPAVGTVREWVALDAYNNRLYRKSFTLRAVGTKIEVWVASGSDDVSAGTAFPAGDCRNAVAGSTDITDEQALTLVAEFDETMYPKESEVFSTPPDRNGSKAQVTGDFSGSGDKIVTLVDNIRDDNFFTFPQRPTYTAGFFSSQINDLVDRNVMTIDAFDWAHRTGDSPPNDPTSDLCTSRPAQPHLYEGVFAHEYQHLLHHYLDPVEEIFVDEGLSDMAMSLTGYANSLASVDEPGAERHLFCFHGYGTTKTTYNPNPRDCGGPQNSLTVWGDEGSDDEILADYGNSWSFMLFLFDRYGKDFISALHRDGDHQGLAGIQAQLDKVAPKTTVADAIHDYQVMNLVDDIVGPRGTVLGVDRTRVTTASLTARLNLDNPASYAIPGAAPNGADYVRLRDSSSSAITGDTLRSLSFTGTKTLPPRPLAWTVVDNAPGGEKNPVLWSGNTSNLDAMAVTEVAVPAASPRLTFRERHLVEDAYDYAYTMISADGGKTYTALANANTVSGPLGAALTGDAAAFAEQSFDLSAYAGKTVLLGFRYVSDSNVNDGGWYVDDVMVGTTLISNGSDLASFRSPTEICPIEVANWSVRLVGIDEKAHRVAVHNVNTKGSFSLESCALRKLRGYPVIVAVIAYDDPTGQVKQFAPYTLVVNGVNQPGG